MGLMFNPLGGFWADKDFTSQGVHSTKLTLRALDGKNLSVIFLERGF